MAPLTTLRRALAAPVLLLALAVLAVSPAVTEGRVTPSWAAQASGVEGQIVNCTNQARVTRGLPSLRRSSILRHAASYHAHNMLRYGFFNHDDVFGQSPADRVAHFGRGGIFRWVGENIAVGNWSASDVCRAWMASSEHRANILSRHYTMIGVGYARGRGGQTYFVQDFGSRFAR